MNTHRRPRDDAPENVFDLELKYGALAIALAYLVGYQFEVGYASRFEIPISEMQVTAPGLLARGFTVIFLALLPTIAAIAYFRFILPIFPGLSGDSDPHGGDAKPLRGYESVVTWVFPLLYCIVLLGYFYHRGAKPFGTVWWIVIGVYAINAGIGTLVLEAEQGRLTKMGRVTQLAAVLAFLLVFRGGAINYGKIEERAQRNKMARLLVAPEALEGARQIGIPFGNSKSPSAAAQLSDPVSFVYQG